MHNNLLRLLSNFYLVIYLSIYLYIYSLSAIMVQCCFKAMHLKKYLQNRQHKHNSFFKIVFVWSILWLESYCVP